MKITKKSFFDRLTGMINAQQEEEIVHAPAKLAADETGWMEEEDNEGELAVDVFQMPEEIIIKTMVAGVKPDDLDITISRDMITIKGRREDSRTITDEHYFHRELYWGTFSRTIVLPEEIEPEDAEATERNGLLTIRLPKVKHDKQMRVRVKST